MDKQQESKLRHPLQEDENHKAPIAFREKGGQKFRFPDKMQSK